MPSLRLNRFFLFSILFLGLITAQSCSMPKISLTGEFFTPSYMKNFQENSFKISIEAYGNHFGGILVAKRLENQHYRFAFLNEFGGKMLDFELIDSKLKLNYAIDELNRKTILNLLGKDFAMIFGENLPIVQKFNQGEKIQIETYTASLNRRMQYSIETTDEKETKAELIKKQIEAVADYTFGESRFPEIEISHQKQPIKIYLHLLQNH